MISRSRRTWILIHSESDLLSRLSGEILEKYPVREVDLSHEGLVMLKFRDAARGALFYLGEVLVTETKVRINHDVGLGIVRGSEAEKSYRLAVVDAAFNAGLPEAEIWTELLLEEEKLINEQRCSEHLRVMETKVDFETMDVPL